MNKVSLCWLALGFCCCEGFGQTNRPAPLTLFSPPHLEVKTLEYESEPPAQKRRIEASEPGPNREALAAPTILANGSTNSRSAESREIELSSSIKNDSFQRLDIYRRLETGGYLTKPERREVDLPTRYVGFEIPDKFAIGYSLDHAERYRNLPYVAALRPQ